MDASNAASPSEEPRRKSVADAVSPAAELAATMVTAPHVTTHGDTTHDAFSEVFTVHPGAVHLPVDQGGMGRMLKYSSCSPLRLVLRCLFRRCAETKRGALHRSPHEGKYACAFCAHQPHLACRVRTPSSTETTQVGGRTRAHVQCTFAMRSKSDGPCCSELRPWHCAREPCEKAPRAVRTSTQLARTLTLLRERPRHQRRAVC